MDLKTWLCRVLPHFQWCLVKPPRGKSWHGVMLPIIKARMWLPAGIQFSRRKLTFPYEFPKTTSRMTIVPAFFGHPLFPLVYRVSALLLPLHLSLQWCCTRSKDGWSEVIYNSAALNEAMFESKQSILIIRYKTKHKQCALKNWKSLRWARDIIQTYR